MGAHPGASGPAPEQEDALESDETLSDDEIETTGGAAIASETADADADDTDDPS